MRFTQEVTINAISNNLKIIPIVGVPTTFTVGEKSHRFVVQNLCKHNSFEALIHYATGQAIGNTNNLIAFIGPSGKVWPLSRHDRAGLLINKVARSYGPEALNHLMYSSKVLNK